MLKAIVSHVSENRLEKYHDALVSAIANGYSPSHLTMRMVDYQKEDHFRELVLALKNNTTLRYLDISKASLPSDASHETCEALQQMFTENQTLEELDISGEYAHLEVAKFGIGLNLALTGLKRNRALQVLRIECGFGNSIKTWPRAKLTLMLVRYQKIKNWACRVPTRSPPFSKVTTPSARCTVNIMTSIFRP